MTATPDQELKLKELWLSSLPNEELAFPHILKFFDLLLQTNQKVNLFSRKLSPEMVFQDQILDCALGLDFFKHSKKVLDFGCGGGLPGTVLAICRPELELVLCDKSAKKIHHVEKICHDMDLKNTHCATSATPELFKGVDTMTSRAVASASKLLALAEPHFCGRKHRYLLYKARRENIDAEITQCPKGFDIKVHPIAFPGGLRERHIVEIIPEGNK
jgi:16S rRNA (guanine(527)-N(7))-methyltransferase RsmG